MEPEKGKYETATQNNIQMKLYRMCDELGIERRSPHKLRKTYISTLFNEGFDPDFVRQQAGHKQLQTTLNNYTYSTTRDDVLVEKLNKVLAIRLLKCLRKQSTRLRK